MEFTFCYDVVCPYAWMASVQIEALAARTGATVRWRPVLLGGLFKHHQAPQVPAATWSNNRAALGLRDIHRQAERLGLRLNFPDGHPRRSVEAMRLCVAAPEAVRPALSADLYRAYWERGQDISDRAVLAPIAAAHGLDLGVIDQDAVKAALFNNTAEAAERGAFGVPTFFVGDRLIWGSDRMHFVEAALGGAPSRAAQPPASAPRALHLFHDFSSPFSYLAFTQVRRIAAEAGAPLTLRPILLGGLFRAIGTPDVPLFAMSPARQRWFMRDMHDWAEWWGVPFRYPSVFPVRSVSALRVSIVEPATVEPIYRAMWAEDRDIGHPPTLVDVLNRAGFDGDALLAAAESAEVKATLRANTEAAAAIGAAGVPTFQVEDIVIWGQDRLDQVEAALRGWRPVSG